MSTPVNSIVSNRKISDNDSSEIVDNYIDELCSNPEFLCKNIEMCGKNTSIYTNAENIKEICNDIKEANTCENDIKECVVLATNSFDDSQKFVSTSFVNIIVPIKNALDKDGNQKFLRLPPLSGSKKKNSNEICNVCACMNRFARSPGSGVNDYTSPGQNQCVYPDDFEYYYYPLYIQDISGKVKDAPPITIGKYTIINSNIIFANTEDDLTVTNLYDILIGNGIDQNLTINFINTINGNDKQIGKEIQLYILDKKQRIILGQKQIKNYNNLIVFFTTFIIFLIIILILK